MSLDRFPKPLLIWAYLESENLRLDEIEGGAVDLDEALAGLNRSCQYSITRRLGHEELVVSYLAEGNRRSWTKHVNLITIARGSQ